MSTYTEVLDRSANGTDTHTQPNSEAYLNTNWQIEPAGTVTAWTITISARLDSTLSWVAIKEVNHDDDPLALIFELASYPHYQVALTNYAGSGAVVVGSSVSPAAASLMIREQPTPELDALT